MHGGLHVSPQLSVCLSCLEKAREAGWSRLSQQLYIHQEHLWKPKV